MAQQVAVRLAVVCGFVFGVIACGDSTSSNGSSASGSKTSGQSQPAAQVGEAGKDSGKAIASAGDSTAKPVGDVGKSAVSGATGKPKETPKPTGGFTPFGKAIASGATKVARVSTDAGIVAAVGTRLRAEMNADAIEVTALSKEGVVTLKGFVPTSAARAKAEEVTKNTSGVKRVVNQLKVK
jgi:hypothetical protein